MMPLKVAVLSRNFSKIGGGAESYAVHLAMAMLSECEITVVSKSLDEPSSLFRHILVPRLPIRSRWINQLWFSWYSKKVTRQGFDIVHSHENVTHGDVQTVHVKTVHASLSQKRMSRWRIALSPRLACYLWIENKRLCGASHHSVFVSQLLLDETRGVLPKLAHPAVIPPGVDIPRHALTAAEVAAARGALGVLPGAMVIGFVGHDFKKKGLATLLGAVALLPFDVQVLVIGNPSEAARYAGQVSALGSGKACRFLGVVRDMPQAYAALDCLAHPTTQDVFPMVLLEAMAWRVPVVTTVAPFNSMASLLTDRVNALLLDDPFDLASLALALTQLRSDNALRESVAENGFAFAQKYSWDGAKAKYYDVYRAAIARKTASRDA